MNMGKITLYHGTPNKIVVPELAFSKLHELENSLLPVAYAEFNEKYNQRDIAARNNMRNLVDSDANKVTKVFSTLFER